jgi:hypothetical protein
VSVLDDKLKGVGGCVCLIKNKELFRNSQSRGSQKCIEWVYRLIKGNTRQASVGLLLNATTAMT